MFKLISSWGFTPAEKRALLLICSAALLGTGFRYYRQYLGAHEIPLTSSDSLIVAAIGQEYYDRTGEKIFQTESTSPLPRADFLSAAQLDLNTATREQLEALPHIGPVLAGRILAERERLGIFKSVDDLLQVKGIGAKSLAQIRPLVVCEPPAP